MFAFLLINIIHSHKIFRNYHFPFSVVNKMRIKFEMKTNLTFPSSPIHTKKVAKNILTFNFWLRVGINSRLFLISFKFEAFFFFFFKYYDFPENISQCPFQPPSPPFVCIEGWVTLNVWSFSPFSTLIFLSGAVSPRRLFLMRNSKPGTNTFKTLRGDNKTV